MEGTPAVVAAGSPAAGDRRNRSAEVARHNLVTGSLAGVVVVVVVRRHNLVGAVEHHMDGTPAAVMVGSLVAGSLAVFGEDSLVVVVVALVAAHSPAVEVEAHHRTPAAAEGLRTAAAEGEDSSWIADAGECPGSFVVAHSSWDKGPVVVAPAEKSNCGLVDMPLQMRKTMKGLEGGKPPLSCLRTKVAVVSANVICIIYTSFYQPRATPHDNATYRLVISFTFSLSALMAILARFPKPCSQSITTTVKRWRSVMSLACP
jgi:uncharacterized membrane protein